MDFFFGVLGVGAIVYYFYRKAKPPSKEEVKQMIEEEIERKEVSILQSLQSSHLKDYMDGNRRMFECGKKNYLRLAERYRHDEGRFKQVNNDWYAYLELVGEAIHSQEMSDVTLDKAESDAIWKKNEEDGIKFQEIAKRFKEQLGEEYVDPFKN